jgi:hypothetical protein
MADIDALSNDLGIPWETKKDIPFSSIAPFIGFSWNLTNRTVSLPESKKAKYLQAILEWSLNRGTRWTMRKSCTESYYMPATFCQPDARISPTWKPSWEFATVTVLSAHAPHPAELRAIFSGGKRGSPNLPSSETFLDPSPSLMPTLTQMLALRLVSASQWATDGEPGGSYQGGKPTAGTSAGQKQSVSGSSFSHLHQPYPEALTPKSLETTEGSLRAGGRAEARNKPTNDIFKHIHALSEAQDILFHTRYVPSKENPADGPSRGEFHHRSLLLPAITIPLSLRQYICNFDAPLSPAESLLLQQGKAPTPSPGLTANHSSKNGQPSTLLWKSTPGPSLPKHSSGSTTSRFMRAVQHTPKAAKPACYTKDLCPLPSTRRLHVLASERLQCWIPLCGQESAVNPPSNLAPDDIRQIAIVMGKSWEESTLAAYGSGLLNFHVYCDQKSIPEDQRAPASPVLIYAFISALAGAYSGSTIDNYVYGIRAWHLIHGVKWQMEVAELEALLRAAEKTTPATSRRKKRVPYTPAFILAIKEQLQMDKPRDAAVYSCLTTAFYATARLGEFTVPNLKAFDPNTHVKPSDVRIEVDRNGLRSTVFHIPKTKTSPTAKMSLGPSKQMAPTQKLPSRTTWPSTSPCRRPPFLLPQRQLLPPANEDRIHSNGG